MRAATLSALALALALPAFGQPAPASKHDVLSGVFQALLTPEQTAQLEQPPSAGRIAALFNPQQKAAAKRSLAARAAATRDPDELAELARGYQLLGEPQGLVEIGAQLATQLPKDSRGYSLAADGMAKQGKLDTAAQLADQALALNPADKRAQGIRVYLAALRESGAGSKPIEAAMIGLPKGEAYKAAAAMAAPRPDSALTVSASKALSDLRPTASRHIPLDLAPTEDPTPKTPWDGTKAAAAAAAATVGSLMLLLGLLPKRLDQDYPWLKASMAGGVLLAGAFISYDLAASHFIYGRYVAWRLASPTTAAVPATAASAAPEAAAPATAPAAPTLPTISMTPHGQALASKAASSLPQAQAEGQALAQEGEILRREIYRRGGILTRVWDSRKAKPGDGFSGMEGRSFCRGACSPINAQSAVERRGLNIPGVTNNAQRGGIFRVKEDVEVIVRKSIGGVEEEILLLNKADFKKLELIEEYLIPPGPMP